MSEQNERGFFLPPHQDTFAGVALLLFCALAFWLTRDFTEVPPMLSQNIPPTFFPRLILGVIAMLSIVLLLTGLKKPPDAQNKVRGRVFATAAIIVLATVLVIPLGTLITLFLVTFALPLCWGERRYALIAMLALGLPVAVYMIFALALGVRFPPGPIMALFV